MIIAAMRVVDVNFEISKAIVRDLGASAQLPDLNGLGVAIPMTKLSGLKSGFLWKWEEGCHRIS